MLACHIISGACHVTTARSPHLRNPQREIERLVGGEQTQRLEVKVEVEVEVEGGAGT